MSSYGASGAHGAARPATSARAAASRANGAKSRGPKTAAGKARSSQNALKHGLCANKHLLLHDEDRAELGALDAALLEDLAPRGALQEILAARIASAAWRMARADRMEAEILDERGSRACGAQVCPGLALIRDGNGPRAFEALLRYRGALLAELLRSLKALKALKAEATKAQMLEAEAASTPEADPAPVLVFPSKRTWRADPAPAGSRSEGSAGPTSPSTGQANADARPNQPERRGSPSVSERTLAAGPEPAHWASQLDGRGNPGTPAPAGPPDFAICVLPSGPARRGSDEPDER